MGTYSHTHTSHIPPLLNCGCLFFSSSFIWCRIIYCDYPIKWTFFCMCMSGIYITLYTTPLPCPFINYLNKSHSTYNHTHTDTHSYHGFNCLFCCLFYSYFFHSFFSLLVISTFFSVGDSFSTCAQAKCLCNDCFTFSKLME